MPDKPKRSAYEAGDPSRAVLDLVGGRWSVLAIGALGAGPQRFSELQRRVAGISPKVLTQVLRALVRDGLVTRAVFAEVPPHTEYRLTKLGAGLVKPLDRIRAWAENHTDTVLASREAHDDGRARPLRRRMLD